MDHEYENVDFLLFSTHLIALGTLERKSRWRGRNFCSPTWSIYPNIAQWIQDPTTVFTLAVNSVHIFPQLHILWFRCWCNCWWSRSCAWMLWLFGSCTATFIGVCVDLGLQGRVLWSLLFWHMVGHVQAEHVLTSFVEHQDCTEETKHASKNHSNCTTGNMNLFMFDGFLIVWCR